LNISGYNITILEHHHLSSQYEELAIISYPIGIESLPHEFNISQPDASRMETYELKNENTADEELIINGNLDQTFYSSDSPLIYRLETVYVADKDGYRAKYKLILLPMALGLSPNTLKTIAG
ncbi:hypothetical protein DOY81_002457, partial [Sarcophaga bullata]